MGIQLVEKDEQLTTELQGVTFTYRRMSSTEQGVIERKHTHKGRVNWRAVSDEVLKRCLIDWDGVTDKEGEKVPFDSKLVLALPEEAKGELADLLYASDPGEHLEKNSGTGSKASTATED